MNNQVKTIENEKFSLKKTLGYCFYQAGYVINALLLSYVTFYATDSLLLSAASIGLVLAFSRVFDGFTDIAAGIIIDKTKTKFGTARPYLLCGVVAQVMLALMFSVPNISNTGKLIWLFVTYNLNSSIFGTFFNILNATLLRRMIVKQDNRVKVLSYNGVFNNCAVTAVNIILPIVVAQATGNPDIWSLLGFGMGAVGVVLSVMSFILCKEYTDEELVEMGVFKEQDQKKKVLLKDMLVSIIKNKYFLMYLVAFFVNALYIGISYSVGVYYFNTNLGNLALLSSINTILIVSWPLNFIYPKIIAKTGMMKFAQGFLILAIIASIARMFVGSNLVLLAITSWLSAMVTGAISMLGPEMTIQCMEYSYLKNGIKAESIYNSFLNFVNKIGMGLGGAILGFVLTSAGYDGALAIQPESAKVAINMMYNVFPAVCGVIIYIVCRLFKVEKVNAELRAQQQND